MWGTLILVFIGMWLLQVLLTIRQSRHYARTVREMSRRPEGFLGVGVVKQRLGLGSVVIIVSDREGIVVEARELSGVTVFSRFRPMADFLGASVKALAESPDGHHRSRAVRMAAERILDQANRERGDSEPEPVPMPAT